MHCLDLLLSLATLCVGLMSLRHPMVHAIPLRQFYPFGADAEDRELSRSDDGASEAIPLLPGFKYFGSTYTNIFVSLADTCNFIAVAAYS